jgi:hypothetical protein
LEPCCTTDADTGTCVAAGQRVLQLSRSTAPPRAFLLLQIHGQAAPGVRSDGGVFQELLACAAAWRCTCHIHGKACIQSSYRHANILIQASVCACNHSGAQYAQTYCGCHIYKLLACGAQHQFVTSYHVFHEARALDHQIDYIVVKAQTHHTTVAECSVCSSVGPRAQQLPRTLPLIAIASYSVAKCNSCQRKQAACISGDGGGSATS